MIDNNNGEMKAKVDSRIKTNKRTLTFLRILSIIFSYLPILIYAAISFGIGSTTTKVVITFGFLFAVICCIISALQKTKLRSAFWIIVLGISFAFEQIVAFLLIMTVSTAVDEFILEPLIRSKKLALGTDKELKHLF